MVHHLLSGWLDLRLSQFVLRVLLLRIKPDQFLLDISFNQLRAGLRFD